MVKVTKTFYVSLAICFMTVIPTLARSSDDWRE